MTTQTPEPSRRPRGGPLRRVVAAAIFGFLFFGVLWWTVFNAMTAALVGSGGAIVLVAGSAWSDTFSAIFDVLAEVVLGILSAIGDFFAAIFSIFD